LCASGWWDFRPAGCTIANNEASSDGGSAAGAGGGGPATTVGGLSCLEVLQCAIDCNADDNGCEDVCLANGDAAAQVKAQAFSDCLAANACADETCLEEKCSESFIDCVSGPAHTGGAPIVGEAPPGSIPAEFVGTWKYTSNYGASAAFTFNADGTVFHTDFQSSGVAGCSPTMSIQDEGTAIFDAARTGFTFYITKSTQTTTLCGPSETVAGPTGAFDFTIEPIPALGPGHMWIFHVQNCPVTEEADKRIQCGNEYDL